LNYAGKFGSLDSHSSGHLNIDSLSHVGHGDTVTIPDAHLLFSGDYARSGADLVVSDQLHRVVVPNYFVGDKRPTLISPEGAPLDAKVIEALTGHVNYAQAAGTAPAAKVIGHVIKMTGSASIVRNGVTIDVNSGDNIYQNDVVQTGSGSTLGLVLIDGTTFNMTAGARLMLNDLTYDANSTSNTSLITLVQGAASFVAGQVAKTGDMKVATPIATMGIRGTAVILDISSTDGTVSVSVVDQRDGQEHSVQVFNTRGDLIGTVTSRGSGMTLTPTTTFQVIAQESNKTLAQIQQEFNAFQILLQTYDAAKQQFPDLPQHTENVNPQSWTKYAGIGSSSPDGSPYTQFQSAISGSSGHGQIITPTTVVLSTPASTDFVRPASLEAPVVVQQVVVPTTSIPFVVNPSTVLRISSGDGDHFGPVMSADGRFVTYDPDGVIYLFDRQSDTTIKIAAPDGEFTYGAPTVSSDGHTVVYQRSDGVIFLYNNDPSDAAHYRETIQLGPGTSPAISGDGTEILVEHGGNSIGIYDRQGHELAVITPASIGVSGTIWKPAVSGDGHVIAFWHSDSSAAGGAGQLFTYDLSTGAVVAIASTATGAGSAAASFSADGRYVVYQSEAPGGHPEIYLYDLATGHVVFQTANAAGASYSPVISPDGHYIIFASDARLTGSDTNSFADIYVVDVTNPAAPVYKLVSALADGTQGNAASNLGATISAGGLFYAFGSSASNFSTNDINGSGDIFIVDPTSGRSAIIQQSADSPSILTAAGIIGLTGDHSGTTLSVSDPSRFTAGFDSNGDIQWNFSEPKSDFASLPYGQDASQSFFITLTTGGITTTIPVTVTVHNAVQPPVTVVNTPPTIHNATLTVSEGQTVTLSAADIGITDINDTSFTFKVTDVTHGRFQVFVNGTWMNTATFTSAELAGGQIRFMHDGGEAAPTFSIVADDGEALNHRSNVLTGTVNFTNVNDAPVISYASLGIREGGTVVLGPSDFHITHTDNLVDFSGFATRADLPAFSSSFTSLVADLVLVDSAGFSNHISMGINDPDSSSFTLIVSNVTHGTFQTTTDGVHWVNAGTFTTADINASHVRFVHDGSEYAPTFTIQADDGSALNDLSNTISGAVNFFNVNDAATITGQATGSVTEDISTTISGTLTVHDPDNGDAVFQAVAGSALAGAYGNFAFNSTTGAWSYALAHGEADGLRAGQVVHDTLTVTSRDGTASQLIDVTITGSNDAPVILGESDAPTQAVVVLNPATLIVLGQTIETNSLGLGTETFDGQSVGSASNNGAGYGNFHSAVLDATFSGSGHAGVVHGGSAVSTAPIVGPLPGVADATNYLSIGAGGTETITFATERNVFGLYWGTIDPYNTISFYHGTTLVVSYTGAEILPLFPDDSQGLFSSNGYVQFSGLGAFDRVVLNSSQDALEIDNISAGYVPAPHVQLAAPISGTMTVADADIGDTLTASVVGNAVVHYNGSTTLPGNADVAALIAANAVTFDSVQSDGGTEVLHWAYDPTNPDLDFLKPGDTLTLTFTAQVNDGHGSVGNQPLTITIAGADPSANMSQFDVVSGTAENDTFHNVGGGVTIFGGGGQDTFVFNANFGSATIADFDVNNDAINIDHTLFASVSALLASAQSINSGHDTIIMDAAHNAITLTGVTVAQIQAHPGDFHLV
jgi:VCBS repeat-containing protein